MTRPICDASLWTCCMPSTRSVAEGLELLLSRSTSSGAGRRIQLQVVGRDAEEYLKKKNCPRGEPVARSSITTALLIALF